FQSCRTHSDALCRIFKASGEVLSQNWQTDGLLRLRTPLLAGLSATSPAKILSLCLGLRFIAEHMLLLNLYCIVSAAAATLPPALACHFELLFRLFQVFQRHAHSFRLLLLGLGLHHVRDPRPARFCLPLRVRFLTHNYLLFVTNVWLRLWRRRRR
ncbi:hypothetical protein V8G54_037670, partial [Vigna mungo]